MDTPGSLDLILQGGRVADGTGGPLVSADVGVRGARIAAIGALNAAPAARLLDCTGLVVAPGFIDAHSHSDLTLLANPRAESKVHQGVTTEVVGQCGMTVFPVREGDKGSLADVCAFLDADAEWSWTDAAGYLSALEAAGPSVNVAACVGHSAVRGSVLGFGEAEATPDDLARMQRAAQEAFDQGAAGISFGLTYALGCFASFEEVAALCRVAADAGRPCAIHIRDEGAGILESIDEALHVARASGARVHVAHLKAAGAANWGRTAQAIERLERAAEDGLDVSFDAYPYTAGSRHLSGSLPAWAQAGSGKEIAARLHDPSARERIRQHFAERGPKAEHGAPDGGLDLSRTLITAAKWPDDGEIVGKSVQQIADERGADPVDCLLDLIAEQEGHVSCVLEMMSEADVERVLAHRLGCVASDGLAFAPYGPLARGKPHPRCYGCFPRLLGRYVRERGLLSLEDAVRKCTSYPAERFGLPDRGVVRVGMAADLVVFDPRTIRDTATYLDPHRYPEGVVYVLVNGQLTIDEGEHTGASAGRVFTF